MSLSNWRKRLGGKAITRIENELPAFMDIGSVMTPPNSSMTQRLDLGGGIVLTVTRS